MKKLMKYCGYLSVSLLVVGCLYLMNLFSTKPYSLDHFLAKELIVSMTESPEYMTYLGLFDNFDFITKHSQKLSIPSAEQSKENYENNVKKLKIIEGFDMSDVSITADHKSGKSSTIDSLYDEMLFPVFANLRVKFV